MFGSARPPKPHERHSRPPADLPDLDDRYTPTDGIRLDMVDVHGGPVTVILTPRAARHLAEQLFARLCLPTPAGGAS